MRRRIRSELRAKASGASMRDARPGSCPGPVGDGGDLHSPGSGAMTRASRDGRLVTTDWGTQVGKLWAFEGAWGAELGERWVVAALGSAAFTVSPCCSPLYLVRLWCSPAVSGRP